MIVCVEAHSFQSEEGTLLYWLVSGMILSISLLCNDACTAVPWIGLFSNKNRGLLHLKDKQMYVRESERKYHTWCWKLITVDEKISYSLFIFELHKKLGPNVTSEHSLAVYCWCQEQFLAEEKHLTNLLLKKYLNKTVPLNLDLFTIQHSLSYLISYTTKTNYHKHICLFWSFNE